MPDFKPVNSSVTLTATSNVNIAKYDGLMEEFFDKPNGTNSKKMLAGVQDWLIRGTLFDIKKTQDTPFYKLLEMVADEMEIDGLIEEGTPLQKKLTKAGLIA